jgi:succinate dehydrogenase/fumarate reductase flavoprotein subunit
MMTPTSHSPIPESPIQTIETDVLIVGGGVSGSLAVIGAAEAGARVVVCDKGGRLERAGSVAGGVDHFFAVLEEGPEWDTPEYLLRYVPSIADGITDLDVAEVLVHGLKDMVHRLENMGVDFHDPEAPATTGYHRHRVFGLPGEYTINFDGGDFKHILGRGARRTGAKVLERTMVTDLLMENSRPTGALAFNFRTGELYLILARAVILATGDINRLSKNASGHAFDSWHLPYNTGDGQVMALRSGARLANMEFIESTISPKGYSSQGLNAFMGGGAYLINSLGERFMFNYHPSGELARRADLIHGVVTETLEGRSPIYIDCTHLPREEAQRLVDTLGIDRPAMPAFFQQKDIDLTEEPFEITVSEMSIRRGGVYFRGCGVHIDPEGSSSIQGLYAAGDCSSMSAGIAGAAVMGLNAGQHAGRYALSQPKPKPLADDTQARLREGLYLPLNIEGGILSHVFEDQVRSIVTDHIGYRREEGRMHEGLRKLQELQEKESEMVASDYHGIMRINEARNLRYAAEVMAISAIERKESRSGAAHVRLDYPEPDNDTGLRIITVEQVGEELQISSEPTGLSPEKPAEITE